jgi:subtilisin family serine protease
MGVGQQVAVKMTIYIVRPRIMMAHRLASLIETKFAPRDRQRQLRQVSELRTKDHVDQEIRKWLHYNRAKVHLLTDEKVPSPVTGTTLVRMSDPDAENLRREIPEAIVFADRGIESIRPRKTAGSKSTVNSEDLWHLEAIGLKAARKNGFSRGGEGVTVAVMDTGIDGTHPELEGRVSKAYTFDVQNWKVVDAGTPVDTDGHGTHVGGLIAGRNVGVAPNVRLWSCVMIPGGMGNLSDLLLALEWVGAQSEVQIVNMSAGLRGYLPEMRDAVAGLLDVGVLPVFAIGNEGRDLTRSPGNYNEVLSIGASTRDGRVASFSGGATMVADNHQYVLPDLVAPGENVYSSVMGGGYEKWSGTSMATPIVAGVAALILDRRPEITVSDLMEEILTTCKDLGLPADRQGKGLVQINSAI